MKKLFSIAVILTCVICLFGCSSNINEETDETDKNKQVSVFDKPLTFICNFSAGGDTDFNSRLVARCLEEYSGQTIVCNNVVGGNGAIALTQYKDAEPDNCTFVLTNSASLSGNYATGLMDFSYDAYDPVAIYGISSGEVILVPEDSPFNSLEELVIASQKEPNSIVYGGPTGGASYLACYLALSAAYDAKMTFLEAGDGSERLASLIGGHIDVCNSALLNCRDYIDSGKLKPLATLLSNAPDAYPNIPVAKDSYPLMIQDTYYVILALKGTDPAIIEELNSAVSDIVSNNTSFQDEYYKMNMQKPISMSVEETKQTLEQQKNHFVELAGLMEAE